MVASLSCAELGTAQPQLVKMLIKIMIKTMIKIIKRSKINFKIMLKIKIKIKIIIKIKIKLTNLPIFQYFYVYLTAKQLIRLQNSKE